LKSPVVPIEDKVESEVDEIKEIIEEVDAHEAQIGEFAFEVGSLKDKLINRSTV